MTYPRRIALVVIILIAGLWALADPNEAHAKDYSELYAKVAPAVLSVSVRELKTFPNGMMGMQPGFGSGFLIEPDLVMTAAHVVDNADSIAVSIDSKLVPAILVSIDEKADVALLRLPEPLLGVEPLPIAASADLKIGSEAFVVGYPYNLGKLFSQGNISAILKQGKLPSGMPIEMVYSTVPINQGNSGGPMFNDQGEVIGVVRYTYGEAKGFAGISASTAIDGVLAAILEDPLHTAGLSLKKLSKSLTELLGLPANAQLVQRVVKDSVAGRMGLKGSHRRVEIGSEEMKMGGDIILSDLTPIEIAKKLACECDTTAVVLREGNLIYLHNGYTVPTSTKHLTGR